MIYMPLYLGPLTSMFRNYPSCLNTDFDGKGGQIALDQLKCVDKERLIKKIGTIDKSERIDLIEILSFIFKPE